MRHKIVFKHYFILTVLLFCRQLLPARRSASAVYAMAVCPSVCLSVCLSQSCPWVGLTHGSGWVGSRFSSFCWVGFAIAKVLKIRKDYVNAFKPQLDTIRLHQAVKCFSCIGSGRVGSSE